MANVAPEPNAPGRPLAHDNMSNHNTWTYRKEGDWHLRWGRPYPSGWSCPDEVQRMSQTPAILPQSPRLLRLLFCGQISLLHVSNWWDILFLRGLSYLDTRSHFFVGGRDAPKDCLPWYFRLTIGANGDFKMRIFSLSLIIHIGEIYMASFAPPPWRCSRDVWDMS